MTSFNAQSRMPRSSRASAGFTLLELVVAMAVFLVLGSAAVRLANQSVGVSVSQQGQSALNISVRNATAQMQIDLINAGTGYFPTSNIPGAPLGIMISPDANSRAGFDTLTILSFDPTYIANPTNTPSLTTSSSMTITPVGVSPSALASGYNWSATNPTELIIFSNTVKQPSGLPKVTTVLLTKAPTYGSTTVTINYGPNQTPVAPNGTWLSTTVPSGKTYPTDPIGISTSYGYSDPIPNGDGTSTQYPYLDTSFDNTDWVLKVSSVQYSVNTSNQLVRTVNNVAQVIADNIVGFKVGAMIYSGSLLGGSSYKYLPANPVNDPRQIRSVRVSLIGSTTPNPNSPFRNTYDGGPYRVEGTSFIVNPRNLSLHD